MSVAAIYNAFGRYEEKDGQLGITLTHGGVPFWFPYQQVTYIPDYTMRELDEKETLFETGGDGRLVYKTFRLTGQRIAEELLETQVPHKNSDKGIMLLHGSTPKAKTYRQVFSGVSEEGALLYSEVQEVEPTANAIAKAEQLALRYKQEMIKTYFQSKRERMAGGAGYFIPTGFIRLFMDELGVQDIDDVFSNKNQSSSDGIDKLLALLQQGAAKAAEPPAVSKGPAPKQPAASLV